ncbi:hypothetical protein GMST_15930 [Geomonas silvestris]|uniref:Uncharacterized protein n=1 Tax=Geomonas silvestris TaxID=2740184 RepID=A0A6V8MH14_9BACT|nr:hypothetical protein [Geomonas silvestris]GFO59268.1 hypothetical protein GMST_15930 [Geomonas silvestris]
MRVPSAEELLQDPELSFAEFCVISNALDEGLSREQILNLPELAPLWLKLLDTDPES